MIGISLYSLRERWVSFLGTFVIITLGTTLVCAIVLAMATAGERPGYEMVISLLAMMMAITVFVSVFVVSSAFAFSVAQRQREFALLRTLGAPPARIAASVYAEALLVAAAGGALGCVLGAAVAEALFTAMHAMGMVPGRPEVRYEPGAAVIAFGAGAVVASAGVFGPARRIRRIRPIEALREASVDSRTMTAGRWVLGIGFAALTLLAGSALPGTSREGIVPVTMGLGMSAIVAMAFLSPVVVPPLSAALTSPLAGLRGAGAMVVRAGMAAGVRRTAALCAPVLLTTGLLGIAVGMVATTNTVAARQMAEWTDAETVVTATQGRGLSDAQVRRLREIPGARVAVVRTAEIGLDGEAAQVRVADPQAITAAVDPPADQGAFSELGAEGIALARSAARSHGWRVGDEVALRLPDGGRARARVAAVLADGVYQPATYVAAPLLEGRGNPPAPYAYVAARPGADPAAVQDQVRAAVDAETARADPAGSIEPGREENNRMVFAFGALLLGMALLCSCVSIANTLVMSTSDRVRDFAALRLAGATRRQVLGLVVAEALAVVAMGAVLGAAVTAACLVPLNFAVGGEAATALLAFPWWQLLGMTAVCGLLATASAAVPAALAMRGSAA
ncbi:hypothetical protein GCM10027570_06680 [Streptomonospora sediminis]